MKEEGERGRYGCVGFSLFCKSVSERDRGCTFICGHKKNRIPQLIEHIDMLCCGKQMHTICIGDPRTPPETPPYRYAFALGLTHIDMHPERILGSEFEHIDMLLTPL